MRHNRDRPPGKSKVTQDLVPHQFSSQTEHYLMSSPRARKSSRNASAYGSSVTGTATTRLEVDS